MKMRGKVLRTPASGDGLVSAQGKQYGFTLEKHWKSDTPPTIGMVVDVELGSDGEIQTLAAVSENQLAKEQADLVMKAAKEKSGALLKEASARLGTTVLVAWAAFAIAWIFLGALSVSTSPTMSRAITFWDLLAAAHSTDSLAFMAGGISGDKGIYGFLAYAALIGPVVSQFWKHPLAHLGNCLPLVTMLVVTLAIYMGFRDSAAQAQQMAGAFGGNMAADMVNDMMGSMTKAIHIGVGGIIAGVACAYLAAVGLKRYLVAKAALA